MPESSSLGQGIPPEPSSLGRCAREQPSTSCYTHGPWEQPSTCCCNQAALQPWITAPSVHKTGDSTGKSSSFQLPGTLRCRLAFQLWSEETFASRPPYCSELPNSSSTCHLLCRSKTTQHTHDTVREAGRSAQRTTAEKPEVASRRRMVIWTLEPSCLIQAFGL